MPRRANTTTETSGACSRTGCDKRVRVALAIVHEGGAAHLRGFGHDGRGRPVSADTPFPIGSLTKSFTALLVRQAVDAGQLEADAPVQRYLPWFRLADTHASARITLRHLVNQTSGFSRADGIAPLLPGFAPDLALLVAAVLSSLCLPAAWRAAPRLRRPWLRKTGVRS